MKNQDPSHLLPQGGVEEEVLVEIVKIDSRRQVIEIHQEDQPHPQYQKKMNHCQQEEAAGGEVPIEQQKTMKLMKIRL